MAQVPLSPIGSARSTFLADTLYLKNRESLAAGEATLHERRSKVAAGWGTKYVDRVHAKGKLTSRERLEILKDDDSQLFEVGTFVNWGVPFGKTESPAAGVVTAFVRVAGRWTIVIANDNTVASGAWWPQTPEKIQRAQTIALELRLPVIYLVDCSGLYLPEQSRSFPGAIGAGHIFKKNSLLSAEGVPQIAGVFGDCIAGGGYMPIISDRVYMTEAAYMVIAGAALIKGAKSMKLSSLDIGGAEVHVHASGCADVRVPDDLTALRCIRAEIERLPTSAVEYHRAGFAPAPPVQDQDEVMGIVPLDHRMTYAAEEVLARLVDRSLFWEILPDRGREMVVGIGRVAGLYMGFVMNRQGLIPDADRPGSQKPAGILYREGIAKVAAFSRACNEDGIPIVWLQDISGFDIGIEAERQGLLGYGSSLIYTNSTNKVPMFTVLLRKASGAGYYAMAGLPYDPVVQLSTPLTRQSVMEGRTLAIAAFNTKLDDDFEIVATDPKERAAIEEGMRSTEARIEGDMDPYKSASQRDTDEIVSLTELRPWLETLAEAAWQATGYRRAKNPRIWSLHDLATLAPARGEHEEPCVAEAQVLEQSGEQSEDQADLVLLSPGVGYFSTDLARGQIISPGQCIGRLETAGRTRRVVACESALGRIEAGPFARTRTPVGFGDALFRLATSGLGERVQRAQSKAQTQGTGLILKSPQTGRLYHRPAPDEDAFVEPGSEVTPGMPVALIEVMKTFAHVTYAATDGLPPKAKVLRWLAEDGAEVEEGTPLLEFEG